MRFLVGVVLFLLLVTIGCQAESAMPKSKPSKTTIPSEQVTPPATKPAATTPPAEEPPNPQPPADSTPTTPEVPETPAPQSPATSYTPPPTAPNPPLTSTPAILLPNGKYLQSCPAIWDSAHEVPWTFPPLTDEDRQKANQRLTAGCSYGQGYHQLDGSDIEVCFYAVEPDLTTRTMVYMVWVKDKGQPSQEILGYQEMPYSDWYEKIK